MQGTPRPALVARESTRAPGGTSSRGALPYFKLTLSAPRPASLRPRAAPRARPRHRGYHLVLAPSRRMTSRALFFWFVHMVSNAHRSANLHSAGLGLQKRRTAALLVNGEQRHRHPNRRLRGLSRGRHGGLTTAMLDDGDGDDVSAHWTLGRNPPRTLVRGRCLSPDRYSAEEIRGGCDAAKTAKRTALTPQEHARAS